MPRLMKDELFEDQLKRTLGYAPYGGADVGECLAVAGRITKPSLDEWHAAWHATAVEVFRRAEASEAQGDREGARGAFFRASNYFRTAWSMLMGAPVDPRLVAAHREEVASFRRGAALLPVPAERVEIPYADGALPGYVLRPAADGRPRPTLILTNGYDGTAEELYFANGAAAVARGYNVVAFDGPGQGAMVIDRGVPFRPDWEHVITPVVDFTLELPDVDPSRIALIGLSLGGYLAPRAATKEHRLAACISDCGPYDVFQTLIRRIPGPLARQLPDGNPTMLRVLDRILGPVMAKPTAGWALRRGLMVHHLTGPREYLTATRDYSLKGIEREITCPTFVCSAEGDELSADAPQLYDALTCPKRYVRFKAADGAGNHCEAAARTLFHQHAFGWLAEVLDSTAAAVNSGIETDQ